MSESASRVEQLDHGALTWVLVERPTPADVASLAERLGLHPLDAEDLRSREARSKLVARPGYVAAVLDFPVLLTRPRRTSLAQLRLIVGSDFVLVAHSGELRAPVHLMQEARVDPARRAESLASPAALAYAIVRELVEASEPTVTQLRSALDGLHDEVFEGGSGDQIRQIAQLRREVATLNRALRPDVEVLFAMARASYTAAGELDAYWELIADRLQRQVDGLDEAWNGLELLAGSVAALRQEQTDQRLRALLLLAALGVPVIALSSIYALTARSNAGGELELELIVFAVLVATVGLVGWLKRRKLV